MEEKRRVLEFCADVGETLLLNGAEIYRTQQTMELIARGLAQEEVMELLLAALLRGGRL